MSSIYNETQPLLESTMAKGLNWKDVDQDGHLSDVQINVDIHHNGLSRREKNGDVLELTSPKEEPNFRPEKWKTLVAFAFLSANLIFNLMCLSIVHERVPDRTKYPPLPDIFFDYFPPADWALDVSEIIIMIATWSTLILIFFHRHRFIILRRVFVIIGLLYFMRGITMFVTQVPIASTTYFCSPKANSTNPLLIGKRVLQLMSGFGLSINGQHIFCGDYIYSGHTVILTMAYLIFQEYGPRKYFILPCIVWLASAVGIFMVLLSRGHYTVDVVIAYYVTTRVFWIYHTMANNPSLKTSGDNNFLANVWWFPLFSYFEKNVNSPVPCRHEWPLPWPRRFLRHTRIS
ncbi:phosphatidylcholine:ceramide cholinephosphotransferase 2-like [Centruroides sculpturatus]|uniref:phosphatidylcholine:ceramide cholinephosphotransferase 2-like n=1 Tax=Centruroides sculpturatus TaxID=218467 RepID=UPI000C6C8EC9|nr:phosphatidylcholine:ceramide cholinephosphotransferase 2-like [Centruroides sculpturatus]